MTPNAKVERLIEDIGVANVLGGVVAAIDERMRCIEAKMESNGKRDVINPERVKLYSGWNRVFKLVKDAEAITRAYCS